MRISVNSQLDNLDGLNFSVKPTFGSSNKEYDYLTQILDDFKLGSLDDFESIVDLKNV